jgi:hypothetical protein
MRPCACTIFYVVTFSAIVFVLPTALLLQVGAVVCGVDPNLSYFKVQYASMCLLLNPGCLFIATNTDARGHFTPNLEWAGAGATVGAIKGEPRALQLLLPAVHGSFLA